MTAPDIVYSVIKCLTVAILSYGVVGMSLSWIAYNAKQKRASETSIGFYVFDAAIPTAFTLWTWLFVFISMIIAVLSAAIVGGNNAYGAIVISGALILFSTNVYLLSIRKVQSSVFHLGIILVAVVTATSIHGMVFADALVLGTFAAVLTMIVSQVVSVRVSVCDIELRPNNLFAILVFAMLITTAAVQIWGSHNGKVDESMDSALAAIGLLMSLGMTQWSCAQYLINGGNWKYTARFFMTLSATYCFLTLIGL